jgi:hypothetical protein
VTAGLYARVRNPIHVFGGLMIGGIFTFAHRPWWLLIFVVLIPVQLLRVREEEQAPGGATARATHIVASVSPAYGAPPLAVVLSPDASEPHHAFGSMHRFHNDSDVAKHTPE